MNFDKVITSGNFQGIHGGVSFYGRTHCESQFLVRSL